MTDVTQPAAVSGAATHMSAVVVPSVIAGGEVRVNSAGSGWQESPSIATLAGGGFVVTWGSQGGDNGWGICQQIFDAAGVAVGGETRVMATSLGEAHSPSVTALADGGHIVAWLARPRGGWGLYTQRYDANGARVGGQTLIERADSGARDPAVTGLANGGFVVTWTTQFGLIVQQTYDAGGTAQGFNIVSSKYAADSASSAVAALADGGYVVTWSGGTLTNYEIRQRLFDAGGNPRSEDILVVSGEAYARQSPSVTGLADGGYVVVWASQNEDGSGWGIHSQRYDASGSALGGQTRVNTQTLGDQYAPGVAMLSGGGYVVTWQSAGQDGSGNGIYQQRFDAAGRPEGGETRVNTLVGGEQIKPVVATLPNGGHVIAWQSDAIDGSGSGISLQRYTGLNAIEGQALSLKGALQLIDTTTDSGVVLTQIQVEHGTISIDIGTSGATIEYGNGTGTVALRGTVAQINALLSTDPASSVRYLSAGDIPPASTLLSMGIIGVAQAPDEGRRPLTITPVNDAPQGGDATLTVQGEGSYTLRVADFGFSDVEGNGLAAVRIVTLPTAGTLYLDNDGAGVGDIGTAIIAGQEVSQADIAAGKLVFVPAAQANAAAYATMTFQVRDNGGTANGGVDLDATPNTLTFDVTGVNRAPTVTIAPIATDIFAIEGRATSLKNVLSVVDPDAGATVITATLSVDHGTVMIDAGTSGATIASGNGTASVVVRGTLAQVNALLGSDAASNVSYLTATDAPPASTTLSLLVDDGGNGGGVAKTGTASTAIAIGVINNAPQGTDRTLPLAEDAAHVLQIGDFGFVDSDGGSLAAVRITTLPTAGTLVIDHDGAGTGDSGVAVTAGQIVSAADIAAGRLIFAPAANASGAGYASLTFQVQDGGGTAHGGIDLDATPNRLTFDVTPVSDAPQGTSARIPLSDTAPIVLTTANFGFSDIDGDTLSGVTITTLPASGRGTLYLDDDGANVGAPGRALSAGEVVSAADIAAGKLVFVPATTASGAAFAALTFQVRDNGGTANGGADVDPMPDTLTFDFPIVNAAPQGANTRITTPESKAIVITAADFGFTDVDGDTLAGVTITTLPPAGTGTLTIDDDGANAGLPGRPVVAGEQISAAAIAAGKLVFVPVNADIDRDVSFTFQVRDDGGTLRGGIDLDSTPNTLTIAVTMANDLPTLDLNGAGEGTAGAIAYVENQPATLIAPNAIVGAAGGVTFERQRLVVEIASAGVASEDVLLVVATDTIRISDDAIFFGRTVNEPSGPRFVSERLLGFLEVGADGQRIAVYIMPGATTAMVEALTRALAYANTSEAPSGATRTILVSLTDSIGGTTRSIASVAVTPVDDQPVAHSDAIATRETLVATGNVLANDIDVDGGPKAVGAVNGQAAGVGQPILLASGALLTVNADGSYRYDPNGAFAGLTAPGMAGVNGATDSFTYTLAGSTTPTSVTVEITGVDNDDVIAIDEDLARTDLSIAAGVGNDRVTALGDTHYMVDGGDGDDIIRTDRGRDQVTGGSGNDRIDTGAGNDRVDGGAGDDTIIAHMSDGDDLYDGSDGSDTADYSAVTAAMTIDLREVDRSGDTTLLADARIRLGNVLAAHGLAATTAVGFASEAGVALDVLRGIETIIAGSGNDRLSGNAANNRIVAGSGDDVVSGGGGDDILDGGTGSDTLFYGDLTNAVRVDLSAGTVDAGVQGGLDTVRNFETVVLGGGADDFVGSGGDDVVEGGAGDDSIAGRGGYDTVVYRGVRAADGMAQQMADHLAVTPGGALGTDRLREIEKIRFIDGTHSFDIDVVDGNAVVMSRADTATLAQAATLTIAAPAGVLANDVNLDQGGSDLKIVSAVAFGGSAGTVGQPLAGNHGTLTLNTDGSYSYVAGAATRALPAGATLTDVFSYTADDGQAGDSSPATLTITITGSDDVATITGAFRADVLKGSGAMLTATGTLTASDPDTDQSGFVAQTAMPGTNGYGTFTLTAQGAWTYSADNDQAAIRALGPGATLTDSFTAVSIDGSASQTVTVTINGANAPLTLTGGRLATYDDTPALDEFLTVSGRIGSLPAIGGASGGTPADGGYVYRLVNAGTSIFGTLTLQSNGDYSFAPSTGVINSLLSPTTHTYRIEVSDSTGAKQEADFLIALNGVNDTPIITGGDAIINDDISVSELRAAIRFSLYDIDGSDRENLALDRVVGINGYGYFSINAYGRGSYVADNRQAAIRELGVGQSITDSVVVTSADGSATKTITVRINGVNDAPVLTGGVLGTIADTAAYDVFTTITGAIDASTAANTGVVGHLSDLDQIGTYTFARAGSPSENAINDVYGMLTVDADGRYRFVPNDVAINALDAPLTLNYTIRVDDGSGAANATATAVFTLTLNGVAETAAVGPPVSRTLTEDSGVIAGNLVATGTLPIGAAAYVPQTTIGTYGTLVVTAGGRYTFTAINQHRSIQEIGQGITRTDSFVAFTADGAQQFVNVLISGANDTPTLQPATHSFTLTESNTNLTVSGRILAVDMDSGDTIAFSRGTTSVSGQGGVSLTADQISEITAAFSVDATSGAYRFDLYSPNYLDEGQSIVATFDVAVADQHGATVVQTISVVINGTIETPYIGSEQNKWVFGTLYGDLVYTGPGDDVIDGRDGNDRLFGEDGNDTIQGGLGDDLLSGGSGNDTLTAGEGVNTVDGGPGVDTAVLLGRYADYAIAQTGGGAATFVRADGRETTEFTDVERYRFSDGTLLTIRPNGEHWFDLINRPGPVTLAGTAGFNVVFLGPNMTADDWIDLGGGTDQIGLVGTGSYTLADNLLNSEFIGFVSGSNTAYGDGTGSQLYAYDVRTSDATVAAGVQYVVQANALVEGESLRFNGSAETDGSFVMFAGRGTDTMIGGAGDDQFVFAEGRFSAMDSVQGGAGFDSLVFRGDYRNPTVFGDLTLTGVEIVGVYSGYNPRFGIAATDYHYHLVTADANVSTGESLIIQANDLRANETMTFDGRAETDGAFRIYGGRGADVLMGGAGNDLIAAGGGADRLIGGRGGDTLTGGAGADRFVYLAVSDSNVIARDEITDFAIGDLIDLSEIDAVVATGANDSFSFIRDSAFTRIAGQLRVVGDGAGAWLVEGDIDGDGLADLSIRVTSDHAITATDFVL